MTQRSPPPGLGALRESLEWAERQPAVLNRSTDLRSRLIPRSSQRARPAWSKQPARRSPKHARALGAGAERDWARDLSCAEPAAPGAASPNHRQAGAFD
eukprot:scaffold2857_cov399-Prasinococcus_capsulatus_cf.AAC.12